MKPSYRKMREILRYASEKHLIRGHDAASYPRISAMRHGSPRLRAAVLAGIMLLLPSVALGWGDRAHRKIAELAFEELPTPCRSKIIRYKNDILDAAEEKNKNRPQNDSASSSADTKADIQILQLLPHEINDVSHYYAHRLGTLSRAVADSTLPFACSPNLSDKVLQGKFEDDIDGDLDSLKARNVSTMRLAYPDSYLERKSGESQKSEGFVKNRYLGGKGYGACKDDVVVPSFRRAVEAVTNVWMTILSQEDRPMAIPPRDRLDYYMSQIRCSSAKGYLEDVQGALLALECEGRRIPLTPTLVGQDFFNLSCSAMTKRIYDLARSVDPQSAAIADRKRTCDEYVARAPEQDNVQSFARRKIPLSLYGRNGKNPEIFVYEDKAGHFRLTSNPKEASDDYVLINYDPVKKINRSSVVKKVKGAPKTEEYDLEEIIKIYCRQYRVSSALVKAVIKVESDYDPYVVSTAGARGLMQLMPSTALDMQVDIDDPIQNIGGGVQYLSRMLELFNGDLELSLAAYNAGPGSVLRYGGIPPFKETRNYVPKVLSYYEKYKYDSKPVRLTVALNKKPAADYLPEADTVEEEIETRVEVISYPLPSGSSAPTKGVIIQLKNGNPMRGTAYEKAPGGVWLILEKGRYFIKEEYIAKLP